MARCFVALSMTPRLAGTQGLRITTYLKSRQGSSGARLALFDRLIPCFARDGMAQCYVYEVGGWLA